MKYNIVGSISVVYTETINEIIKFKTGLVDGDYELLAIPTKRFYIKWLDDKKWHETDLMTRQEAEREVVKYDQAFILETEFLHD